MRPVPVPKWLRDKEWVMGTRVYSAPDGDLTNENIPPAEGILYYANVEGQPIAQPMVAAVLYLEDEDVMAIMGGARHIILPWPGHRMPMFIVPQVVSEKDD